MTTAADQTFHRPPRAWPEPVPSEPVRVAAPPTEPVPPHASWISTLFPVVGGVGILGFALVYGNSAFLYIALAMICVLLLFSLGMRWSQKRGVRKQAAREAAKYTKYLKGLERDLAKSGDLQRAALGRLYPPPATLWSRLSTREGVWERRPGDKDFLHVRLGAGSVPLDQPLTLDLGLNPLTEYQEFSAKEARQVVGRRGHLRGEAVVADLGEIGVLSVSGTPQDTRGWARALMLQLAAFRAPHDLRIVTAFDEADTHEWAWGKWLPHQQLEQGGGPPALAFARSADELDRLLEPEVRPRSEQLRRLAEEQAALRDVALVAPELVVIVDGYSAQGPHPANDVPAFRELLSRARDLRAVVVLLVADREDEPGDIDARLVLAGRGRSKLERPGPDSPTIDGLEPDAADVSLAEAGARMLAPLRLKEGGDGERSLSAEVRLVDLLEDTREAGRLCVPIAMGEDGEPVVLDLKQAAENGMGPHGVLVGATGSGKSELLRSLVAGLAATHEPEELAFVLADFKGGAAFAELSKLPHVAGLITNLQRDLSLVDRMRAALEGETERRQVLLREAGNLDDIRAYRDRRAADPSLAPMPDLLVIVDEFAELLAARPEFIDLFVQLGRVGRSLGIHLLLSSQRLDEGRLRGLESHLRYRICLRTYSSVESKLVLGTPDAYLLPSLPGLGYLKVDTGVYQQFRAALVSAPARTAAPDRAQQAEPAVRAFDASGDPVAAAPDEPSLDPSRTDLDVLLAALPPADVVHQVWVDPLPDALALDAVQDGPAWWEEPEAQRRGLRAVLGELDVPAEQRKEPLTVDLAGAGGHVVLVGAPRTGRSNALRTLALSLAQRYTPDEVRFYGIDLGGGLLTTLLELPHAGGVAGRMERETVERVIRQMQAEIEEREERLRELGFESIAQLRGRRAEAQMPDLFLLIDGWGVFRREFEDLERDIDGIAAAGLSLGVHVAVTANRWAEIRPALLDNLGTRLELKLHDPLDSNVSRQAASLLAADVPGRGHTPTELQFQLALPRFDGVASDEGLAAALQAATAEIAGHWTGARAEPIRLLPAVLDPAALPPPEGGRIPVGLEERDLAPVEVDLFGEDPHLLVFGDAGTGKTSLLRHVAQSLAATLGPEDLRLLVVDVRRSLVDLAALPQLDEYCAAAPAASAAAQRLATELTGRVPTGSDVADVLKAPEWTGPRYVILCDDYDLLTGPAGGPLQPLLDLLPLGRDIGLHLVLARRVAGSARSAFEPVFSRVRELGSTGVVLSGGTEEGPLIGGVKATQQPPGRGQLVRRGVRPLTVQLALREAQPVERLTDAPNR